MTSEEDFTSFVQRFTVQCLALKTATDDKNARLSLKRSRISRLLEIMRMNFQNRCVDIPSNHTSVSLRFYNDKLWFCIGSSDNWIPVTPITPESAIDYVYVALGIEATT